MRTTPERLGVGGKVPTHEHVPACDVHACNVCQSCGRVHHGGGSHCIGCWVKERTPNT